MDSVAIFWCVAESKAKRKEAFWNDYQGPYGFRVRRDEKARSYEPTYFLRKEKSLSSSTPSRRIKGILDFEHIHTHKGHKVWCRIEGLPPLISSPHVIRRAFTSDRLFFSSLSLRDYFRSAKIRNVAKLSSLRLTNSKLNDSKLETPLILSRFRRKTHIQSNIRVIEHTVQ